jgi:hypothetical protein
MRDPFAPFPIDNSSLVQLLSFLLTHSSRRIGNVGICNHKGNRTLVLFTTQFELTFLLIIMFLFRLSESLHNSNHKCNML